MRLWCLLFFLLGLVLSAAGQPAPAPADGWLPDATLSSLMLRTLVQDSNGLLWVGTDDGVYRYDGTELVSLNALRRGGAALPTVPCNYLLPQPDGQLWLGTEAGLFRFGADGVLQALPLPAPGNPSRAIEMLERAPGGQGVWVLQKNVGLQIYTLAGQPTGPLLPLTQSRFEVWPAPDGTLWLATDQYTSQLSATGRELGRWRNAPFNTLCAVYDPAGRPWLLTTHAAYRPGPGGQLRKLASWGGQEAEEWGDVLRTPTGPALLLHEQVQQLDWTTGPDPQPRPRFAVALPPWPTASWSGRLRADRAGHWWVFDTGTRSCWHRDAAPAFIRALPGPGGKPYSVRTAVRLPDGRLLVSSYGSGLLTQARDSPLAALRPWAGATLPTGIKPVLLGIVPAPVGPGGDWLAVGAYPFLRLNPHTGQLHELLATDQTQAAMGMLGLTQDKATGRVWAATRLGLYWYDPAVATFRPFLTPHSASKVPPLAGRTIEDLWPDGHGHLWLATPEGVERLTLATGEREVYGPAAPEPRRAALDGARCLYLAPDGRLWVGTRTHGLAVLEPDGHARLALTLGQGLPNASVATITPGPGGQLWLGTYQGLVRYQPAGGQLAVFSTAQGLASDECNARAAYIDPVDKSLLIGGVAGMHRVYPGQVPGRSAAQPRLLLTSLTSLSTSAETSRPRYLLAPDGLPALRLAPNAPVVDLHLALANALDPARARYTYRVRGWLADRWLGLGTTPQLRLQGLPPGRYTVEIRGETSQGVPAANVLRLPLTVTAEWYNRPLTWVLAALAAVLAVYWWQRARLRQMQRENALRARLAADLHDEVGSLLTRVTMQAELLREFEKGPAPRLTTLVEDSRAAASTVRDIIWSVDAESDTLGALTDRIRDHLDATARATGRELLFADGHLPQDLNQPLLPTVRQHTYLIFKEALTNALKYSPPGSPIEVELCCAPLLELTVTNASLGTALPTRSGQGLRNMRHRAALLRAELGVGPIASGWQVRLRLLP